MRVRHAVVTVRGRPIRYQTWGDGAPLVLVHGLSGSTRWWRPVLPALVARHRVYLLDLPGFGTLGRARQPFILGEMAEWLLAWLRAVGLARADFAGHSMGGYLCLRLAAAHPEAVRRLVLIAPAGLPLRRSWVGHALALLVALRHGVPGFFPVLLADALRAGLPTLWRAARDLMAEDVRRDLRAIRAPTLLIWGGRDTLVPPTIGHALRAEIRDARLVHLPDAAHVPMFERPRDLAAAMLAFLAGEAVGE